MLSRSALLLAVILVFSSLAVFGGIPQDDRKEPVRLPEGEGKAILEKACASCHELTDVTKFKGFYTRENWQDIVVTMVEYGAPLNDEQIKVLVDYLTKNFGKN